MRQEAIQLFFEFLSNRDLSAQNVEEKVYSWRPEELLDFIVGCQELIPTSQDKASSIFEFNANSQLSGLPVTCATIDCRMKNIDSMARFAVFYSDRVLLRNPFEDYTVTHIDDDDDVYIRVANDLRIIYYIRPLIDVGLVDFVESPSPRSHFCLDCYEKAIFNQPNQFRQKLARAKEKLKQLYIENADFFVEDVDGIKQVIIENNSELSELIDYDNCIKFVERLSRRVESRVKKSGFTKLSKRELLASDFLKVTFLILLMILQFRIGALIYTIQII